MKRAGSIIVPAVLMFTAALFAQPAGKEKRHGRPNYDVRATEATAERAAQMAANPSAAIRTLKTLLGQQSVMALDGIAGTPRFVAKLNGFLTAPSEQTAAKIALDYVQANAAVFKVDLASLQLAREYTSIDGTRHVWWRQVVNGVPVFGNGLKANVTADGRLINIIGAPLADLRGAASAPLITADEALAQTRRDAGVPLVPVGSKRANDKRMTTVFDTGERAQLAIMSTPRGNRLGWDLLVEPGDQQMYRQVIDAATGDVLFRQSLTSSATGLAFPNYPGAPAGGTPESFDLSARGWLNANARILSGPYAHVYADENANNVADQDEEIDREDPATKRNNWLWSLQTFHPAIAECTSFVCTWDPNLPGSWIHNENQSGTQLFIHLNVFHDHLKAGPIGFTREAGNFEGDDPVLGEAFDGSKISQNMPDDDHIDNANFTTPPDGSRPRMQMFLWHSPSSPDPFVAADGANDASIVYHEYTHGLTCRLLVDADGFCTIASRQGGAMSEANSDWYAADFLQKQGLQPDQPGVADVRLSYYVTAGQGVRREPIDCKVGMTAAQGCPGGALTGPGGFTLGDYGRVRGSLEVHGDGEIWAQTLWDLRDALGTAEAESLVTRAMELSPYNPSFLDERNAILQADMVATGGARQNAIWQVFAARGMGWFAAVVDGRDAQPVENFAMPPDPADATSSLGGTISDRDTGARIEGMVVAFGGHDRGAGDYVASSSSTGAYSIADILPGTYPKVSVAGPGYEAMYLPSLAIAQGANVRDFPLRRDWAAASGGGSIASFNGPDYTSYGCGPDKAIDQSKTIGWASDTDNGASTGLATDKFILVKFPAKANIYEIQVDPANTCGDPGSAATRGWRMETSSDGTTFTPLNEGVFYLANRGVMNSVFAGSVPAVQYIRFWILNPQVPTGTDPDAACTGPADCGTAPDDDTGVAVHCGPGRNNDYAGCTFVDMVELAVYGRPSAP